MRASLQLCASVAIALATAHPAHANGAFPAEFSILFPPNAPHRILMGANFGLLISDDDGGTWRYSCEPWVVSGSNASLAYANVSFYQVTADGAFLADSINLTRSADVACTWPISTGSITGQLIADFFPSPTDATFVVANVLLTNASYIVASHDGGQTFDTKHLYDTVDILTGVEISRSKPGVVYATSVLRLGGGARFLASTDSGATWTATALLYPAGTEPRILAVDPADEKKIYLRLVQGVADSVAMSADGGQTFQTILSLDGPLSSFLRAGDGAIYAGTAAGRLYVQPTGTSGFSARSAPHLRCLGQRPGTTRIYACTDMVLDKSSLESSDDGGLTFQHVMSFTQLLGPLTCPPVLTNCQAHWDRIQQVLGIGAADAGPKSDGGGAQKTSGGSHCASAGVDGWSLLALGAFLSASRRSAKGRALLRRETGGQSEG